MEVLQVFLWSGTGLIVLASSINRSEESKFVEYIPSILRVCQPGPKFEITFHSHCLQLLCPLSTGGLMGLSCMKYLQLVGYLSFVPHSAMKFFIDLIKVI